MKLFLPSKLPRRIQPYFPGPVIRNLPDIERVEGRLGISTVDILRPQRGSLLRKAYSYAEARDIRLRSSPGPVQEEVAHGFRKLVDSTPEGMRLLFYLENSVNDVVRWQPFPRQEVGHSGLLLALTICSQILNPGQFDSPDGDWLNGRPGDPRSSFKLARRKGASSIHREDLHDIGRRFWRQNPIAHEQFQNAVRLMPNPIDAQTASLLAAQVRAAENESYPIAGAPSRLAVLPVDPEAHFGKSSSTALSFALLSQPLDPKLRGKFFEHCKIAHGQEARHEKHGAEAPGPKYFSLQGSFPGSMAYARVHIDRSSCGREIDGEISLVQSDVTQSFREYVPPTYCRDLLPFAQRLLLRLGATRIWLPTVSTVSQRAELSDLSPAGRKTWHDTMQAIYGQPPLGFDPEPTLFRGSPHYRLETPFRLQN